MEDEVHQGGIVNLLDLLASPRLCLGRVDGGSVASALLEAGGGRSVTSCRTGLTSSRSQETRDRRHTRDEQVLEGSEAAQRVLELAMGGQVDESRDHFVGL